MSYINNMNPRRMIWFNQNAPKNKMDLWLSYNKHYEDTSEDETTDAQETTDNPSQRNCDLILKAWDCGQWIPIVGFNTTAANKIDIVTGAEYTDGGIVYSGKNLHHPAIFTDESPNELYDAGTLGELLANTNFVTETEWQNLFDTTQFQNAFNSSIIGGNDYNWSTLINNNIDFATTSQCGGILSDTHTYDALSAFKPIEVKFYPTVSAYSSKLHRLCINADDVVDSFIDSFDSEYPLLIGGNGITLGLTLDHSQITWEVSNLRYAEAGKYARSQVVNGNHTIEWVNLPEGVQYTGVNLIEVDNSTNKIGIDMSSNPSAGDIIICDGVGNELVAKWGAVPNPTISGTSINCNNGGVTLNDLQLTSDTSIIIDEEQSSSRSVYNLSTWSYYNLSNCKTLSITSVADTMEPVYIRIISAPYGITCNGDKIDIGSVLTDTSSKDILVTLQFGIAKFEEII